MEPVGDIRTGRCVDATASKTNWGQACRNVDWGAASCSLMRATRPVQQVSAFGCFNGHVHEVRRCPSWPTDFRKKGVHGNDSCVRCVHLLCFLIDVIDQRTHKGRGFGVKRGCELPKLVRQGLICIGEKYAKSRRNKVAESKVEDDSLSLLRIRINDNNQKCQEIPTALRRRVGVHPLFRQLTSCNAARRVRVR